MQTANKPFNVFSTGENLSVRKSLTKESNGDVLGLIWLLDQNA